MREEKGQRRYVKEGQDDMNRKEFLNIEMTVRRELMDLIII